MGTDVLTVSEVRAVADAEQARDVRVQAEYCGPMSSHERMIFEAQMGEVRAAIGQTYDLCLRTMVYSFPRQNPNLADLHGRAVALRKAAEELVRKVELVNR
jgi:hypothetical protein